MKDGSPLCSEWLVEWKYATLIEEAKEQARFNKFYESIPTLVKRHEMQESHLQLMLTTSSNVERE